MLAVALWLASCSGDEPSVKEPNTKVYVGTQAPGDVWEWVMNYDDNTLTMTWDYGTFDDLTDDIAIEGEFELLPSGFYKVVINKVTPATAEVPDDGSAFFYALEVPGTTLVVKPEGSIKGDIISMVAPGDCATLAGNYNYIITAPGDPLQFNSVTDEAFGQVNMAGNGNTVTITGTKSSLDCLGDMSCSVSGAIDGIPTATCTGNGAIEIINDIGETSAVGQFTNAGVMMLDMGKGNGGVLGLKQSSVAISEFNSKAFNGIGYFPTASDGDRNKPISIQFESSNGVALGTSFVDIEAGTIDSDEAVNLQIKSINNGLATGTIFFQDGHKDFAAAVLKSEGKLIMVLTSSSNDEGNPPFILVMVSK